jgi:hypothetical protein
VIVAETLADASARRIAKRLHAKLAASWWPNAMAPS